MLEPLRVPAGDCTVTCETADETRPERGNEVPITKLDSYWELLVGRLPTVALGLRQSPDMPYCRLLGALKIM